MEESFCKPTKIDEKVKNGTYPARPGSITIHELVDQLKTSSIFSKKFFSHTKWQPMKITKFEMLNKFFFKDRLSKVNEKSSWYFVLRNIFLANLIVKICIFLKNTIEVIGYEVYKYNQLRRKVYWIQEHLPN